jgi:hypothetical protein
MRSHHCLPGGTTVRLSRAHCGPTLKANNPVAKEPSRCLDGFGASLLSGVVVQMSPHSLEVGLDLVTHF